ncbi:MAG TPA: hypothetical protein VHL59_00955 [Thermoanaerobaculia bacterium]|nr:hypothetical protein [Thermoanaerobaculia bacterium]
MTLLLTAEKKVVLADGRKPRKSVNDERTIIPGHFPFLAVESNKYKLYDEKGKEVVPVVPVMSFPYDLDGLGEKTALDAFVLDGHLVSVSNVEQGTGDINPRNIPRMGALANGLELCPGVRAQTSRQVVAYVDVSNAKLVEGRDHGTHSDHQLRFGATISNAAEKLRATFARTHDKPTIKLQRRKMDEKPDGQNAFTIELLENSVRVMVANVPAEEVMDLNVLPEGKEIPLTHIELLYDLYHSAPPALPVPRCTEHVKHGGAAGGAHPHTAGGHCGPPMQEGQGG